jgi:hypothetical protein
MTHVVIILISIPEAGAVTLLTCIPKAQAVTLLALFPKALGQIPGRTPTVLTEGFMVFISHPGTCLDNPLN